MAELENIIESVMSSPESMDRIMDVIGLLGGGGDKKPAEEEKSKALTENINLDGNFDPALLGKVMSLVSGFNDESDRRIRLLSAMRPYLKSEDAYHIDRAIQIVKLSRVAKSVFGDFLKKGDLFGV